MLQDILNSFWKDILSESNLNDVVMRPNSAFIGYAGVFKREAITVSSKNSPYAVSLSYNRQDNVKCALSGFLSIEAFNEYLQGGDFSALRDCFSIHSAKPFTACSEQLFFGRKPEAVAHPGLRRARHLQWHADGNSYHTHLYKLTPDEKRFAEIKKEDVVCVLSQYREVAKRFVNPEIYDENGKELKEKLTPDMLISEEEIHAFADFYETANSRLEELANDISKNCKHAFFEAFMLTFFTQIMKRYLFPLIKYHSSEMSKTAIDCLEKAIPFAMLAYRFYLSAMSPMNSLYYTAMRLVGQIVVTGFHAEGKHFFTLFPGFMTVISALHMKGNEEAFKELGKQVGFELGYITALTGSQLAEALATSLIRQLGKLKVEEPSVTVDAGHEREAGKGNLRRRFT